MRERIKEGEDRRRRGGGTLWRVSNEGCISLYPLSVGCSWTLPHEAYSMQGGTGVMSLLRGESWRILPNQWSQVMSAGRSPMDNTLPWLLWSSSPNLQAQASYSQRKLLERSLWRTWRALLNPDQGLQTQEDYHNQEEPRKTGCGFWKGSWPEKEHQGKTWTFVSKTVSLLVLGRGKWECGIQKLYCLYNFPANLKMHN